MNERSMRNRIALTILAAVSGAMLAAAVGQPGYLDVLPDLTSVVPPPPQKGDPRYEADRRVFRLTRSLLSTPRGALAARDVPYTMPDLMRDFSCAAGVGLSPEKTPATYRLLINADADTARANEAAKQRWKHLRPFQIDRGAICESKELLVKSFDYPSGHVTHGWTVGLVLANLEPDRATPILSRAVAYGESRIVCGAHNMSAVEAARLGATVSMQIIAQTARYQADFAAAKAELDDLRRRPDAMAETKVCAAERALTGRSILSSLRK